MANSKIKFKISIKELSVEFEGDTQTAARIQEHVTGAINNLATAPNRLIGSGQQQPTMDIIDVSPTRRRRRRRAKSTDSNSEGSPAELGSVDGGEDGSTRKLTRRSEGPTPLITSLVDEGFFGEPKTAGDIRGQLSKKGHSFKSNELSPILGRLTRSNVLRRDKNSDNQWAYFTKS
jgi:hypothetical protein